MTGTEFLSRLQKVRPTKQGWTALCPAHEDRKASLSVAEADDGRILLNCFAGCPPESIVRALGLEMRDLFPSQPGRVKPRRPKLGPHKIVGAYDYRDEHDTLVFQVVRTQPKSFFQRRPDGQGGWVHDLDGVQLVPYRLRELLAATLQDQRVFIVEGEKDVDTLAAHGLPATTNPMGAGKWRPEFARYFRGARVVVLPDTDAPGQEHAHHVARSVGSVAAELSVVLLPGLPDKGDISDWLAQGHTISELTALVNAAQPWTEAALDLTQLLDDIAALIRRYVVLSPEQCDAIALWVAHTWVFGAAETTLYLNIHSAEKESGKTRLLEVLELVVHRPWLTGRVTPAVLVRKIDKERPTLLLDETDAAFNSGDEYAEALRGVLNTGYRRGGKASVCIRQGGDISYVDLDTFAPKAFAGLNRLPDTVANRSIPIRLQRRRRDEHIERLRQREGKHVAAPLQAHLNAWAGTALDKLRDACPATLNGLSDRAADGWEPLLAIADLAGKEWPERARRAALTLSAGHAREDESLGVRLLGDIRRILGERKLDGIATRDLITVLVADEEAPWGAWGKAGVTPHALAKLLRPFGMRPGTIWLQDGRTAKGYTRGAFLDAWARYLPPDPSGPSGAASDAASREVSAPAEATDLTDAKSPQSPRPDCNLTDLTDLSQGDERADTSRYVDKHTEVPAGRGDSEHVPLRHTCGGTQFWQDYQGGYHCSTCHPPEAPGLVADRLEL